MGGYVARASQTQSGMSKAYTELRPSICGEKLTLAAGDLGTEGNHISILDIVVNVRTNFFASHKGAVRRAKILQVD